MKKWGKKSVPKYETLACESRRFSPLIVAGGRSARGNIPRNILLAKHTQRRREGRNGCSRRLPKHWIYFKQACRFFVPTLMSLQLEFRVHPCILIKLCCPRRKVCMILAFPPHPFSSFPHYRVSPAGMAWDLPCQSSPIITIIPPIYNNNQIIIIKVAGLKAETEGFMIAAQGQSLPTRWYRHNILKKPDVDPNATLGTRGFSRVRREFSRGSL